VGRVGVALVGEADARQERLGPFPRLGRLLAQNLHRALDDVLEGGEVGEEVEALEDHADAAPLARDFGIRQLVEEVALAPVADELARHPAQEGALARAGGADDAEHLALRHPEVDALEHLVAAEALAHVRCDHDRVGGQHVLVGSGGGGANGHARPSRHFVLAAGAAPLEKYFSMRPWMRLSIVTTMRYQKAATISSSMTRELA
jgi:hypothetical protein